MGRPSKLTPTQWEEIGRRLAAGETGAALAREFGVGQATISERFSELPKETIRKLGEELAALPPQAQRAAVTLADELRAISGHLAAGARYGAATAHRLHALAHTEVQKIGDANPMESVDALKGVAVLTKTANEAASMGLNLLAANKDQGNKAGEPVPLVLAGSDVDG